MSFLLSGEIEPLEIITSKSASYNYISYCPNLLIRVSYIYILFPIFSVTEMPLSLDEKSGKSRKDISGIFTILFALGPMEAAIVTKLVLKPHAEACCFGLSYSIVAKALLC